MSDQIIASTTYFSRPPPPGNLVSPDAYTLPSCSSPSPFIRKRGQSDARGTRAKSSPAGPAKKPLRL